MKTADRVDDLYHVPENGKAELVNGELVAMSPTGGLPSSAGGAIYASLRQYQRTVGGGRAYADNTVFAAEVRSENDYGPQAEEEMARKRADYFAAGTRVVWDVDLLGEDVVRVHRATSPEPTIYRRGEGAEAEPAVPGWRMPVDELFE